MQASDAFELPLVRQGLFLLHLRPSRLPVHHPQHPPVEPLILWFKH